MQFKKSFYGLITLLFLFNSSSFAQSTDTLAETRNPREFCLRSIANSTLKDEARIWSKPFTLKKRDFNYLIPALAATGLVMYFDKPISKGFRNYNDENRDLNTYNKTITQFGQGCNNLGLAAVFVAGGLIFKDHRATETGILSAEALLHSGIVVFVGKTLSGRERPLVEEGNGNFDFLSDPNAGSSHHSFPSGHTISAWAMATVIATEYKDVKWVPYTCYTLATAVGVSRIALAKHWPSDVLVGSMLGYAIGRMVVKNHQHLWHVTPYYSEKGDAGVSINTRF
jgi:PAP2 superfamily